ncbi:MAG: hypothetical protein ACM31O_03975 [Bacteroidota bacterium]
MSRELPTPDQILEELADKAAVHIDRIAPVAFDAAFEELTRYHRFLLSVHASRTPDGKPFNYAAVPGEAWHAPHNEWISQYRGLFERAANRIGDAPDFFEKLAHTPLRLLPRRDEPRLPDDVIGAILDLNLILIHRLEAWVTKRTVTETVAGDSASPRLHLAGSDAKAYANLLPNIIGAWESLLQATPELYRWRDEREGPDEQRWNTLRASWPFLWQHLRNTAYMLAVAVWNEDETGTAWLRDALVRWPRALSHCLTDRADLLQRRLLFPDIASLDLTAAQARIRPLLPQHMPVPTPDELFNAMLQGAHDDVLLLTSALLLLWSMEGKQASDIGARTAAELLRKELQDPDDELHRTPQDKTFRCLMMDIVRLEIAGDRRPDGTYGATLDHLVEKLDNMTERRVVPGRVFTPSTLHGRDGIQTALLSMLLARVPEADDPLLTRVKDLAKNEPGLPTGDRSLRDLLHGLDRFTKLLETPPPTLQRGLTLLKPDADPALAGERLKLILTAMVAAIEGERTARLRAMPISERAIGELRDAVENSMLTSPGGMFFFRGFSITRTPPSPEAELITSRFNGLSKAQFVDPPMEWESVGFTKHYAQQVSAQAGQRVWNLFTRRHREPASIAARIEDPAFWQQIKALADGVGAEPMLIVSRQAEGRALRQFVYQLREPPNGLTIERNNRQDMGNSYIATVDGVDVFGADFTAGTAWLFSPYILQAVEYAQLDAEAHIITLRFEPGEDLKGPLIAEFKQRAVWADWPIYEIRCEDPAEAP